MKSYSSLSAYNDTFASNDNPISLLALAISNFLATSSFIFINLAHFNPNSSC